MFAGRKHVCYIIVNPLYCGIILQYIIQTDRDSQSLSKLNDQLVTPIKYIFTIYCILNCIVFLCIVASQSSHSIHRKKAGNTVKIGGVVFLKHFCPSRAFLWVIETKLLSQLENFPHLLQFFYFYTLQSPQTEYTFYLKISYIHFICTFPPM